MIVKQNIFLSPNTNRWIRSLDHKSRVRFDKLLLEIKADLEKFEPGIDRTTAAYHLHSYFLEHKKNSMKETTCKKGCSHCCYIHTAVRKSEGVMIAEYVKSEDLKIDKARLAIQAEKKIIDEFDKLPNPMKRCVFLGADNTCKIYSIRPMVCRNFYVVSNPKLCNTKVHPGGIVAVLNVPEFVAVEIAFSLCEGEQDTTRDYPLSLAEALVDNGVLN